MFKLFPSSSDIANSTVDISIHWRPNYELELAYWWLFVSLWYFVLGISLWLIPHTWWLESQYYIQSLEKSSMIFFILGLIFSYNHYQKGSYNQLWLEHRFNRKLLITSSDKLKTEYALADRWWLGKGFYWSSVHSLRQQSIQQHLQTLTETSAPLKWWQKLGKLEAAKPPLASKTAIGSEWLHSLEFKEEDIFLDCSHTNGHMLIVGTTGSGKTRAFDLLIQQAILRRESVIIIDPKGDHDLREKALKAALKLNLGDRFLAFSPAYAQQSIALDLLGNYSKTSDLAQRIISLIPNSVNAGPFKAVSYKAVLTIIDSLVLLNRQITLREIYLCLTLGMKNLLIDTLQFVIKKYQLTDLADPSELPNMDGRVFNALIRSYIRDYHNQYVKIEAVQNLIEIYQHDHAHLTKMIATLLPGLHVLASPPMSDLITPVLGLEQERVIFNLQQLTQQNYILYVGLDSLSDATLSGNIGSLLLSDLAALAGQIYNYQSVKKPINVFIDEAAEVVNDPFIQILNKGRGAGLRCFTATQTIADFNVRTGSYDKTRQMLGNFNNWLALRTTDFETQKYLAESMRTTRVAVTSMSLSSDDLLSPSHQAKNISLQQTNLISPDILAELPNFEYIARVSGGEVIKGRLPIVE